MRAYSGAGQAGKGASCEQGDEVANGSDHRADLVVVAGHSNATVVVVAHGTL